MKKGILILIVVSLLACQSDRGTYDLLQGSWKLVDIIHTNPKPGYDTLPLPTDTFRFADTAFFIDRSYYMHSYRAWWKVKDSTLQIIYSEILGTDTMNFSIVDLDKEQLTLENPEVTWQFEKINEASP